MYVNGHATVTMAGNHGLANKPMIVTIKEQIVHYSAAVCDSCI